MSSIWRRRRRVADARRSDRLPPAEFDAAVRGAGGDRDADVRGSGFGERGCDAIRVLYEPHAIALAEYLRMSLPTWIPEPSAKDQWKTIEAVRHRQLRWVGW